MSFFKNHSHKQPKISSSTVFYSSNDTKKLFITQKMNSFKTCLEILLHTDDLREFKRMFLQAQEDLTTLIPFEQEYSLTNPVPSELLKLLSEKEASLIDGVKARAGQHSTTTPANSNRTLSSTSSNSGKSQNSGSSNSGKNLNPVSSRSDKAFDKMSGVEFEQFCIQLLKANGFSNVSATKASGDQGIDILAEKDSIKYGIQCKCYRSNIGNAAVQEAYSGSKFYNCHVAVVLTNRSFTPAAVELAKKTGVILWDRQKLMQLISNAPHK